MDTTAPFVRPAEAVAPSHDVAVASGRLLHELAGLRAISGDQVAQVEAMAMFTAAIAFLRPVLGSDGIRQMHDLVHEDGGRIAVRDQQSSAEIGLKRAAAAKRRAKA